MRTRAVLTSIFASVGVLVIGWQAGSAAMTSTQPTRTSSGTSGTSTGTVLGTTTATAPAASGAADGSYTGDDVNTRFGSVQVQITVSGGKLADVTALQLTDHDRRSVQISNRAEPILRSAVLDAQSASVNNVSGATYTSNAYLQSLQSALDQAGL